MFKNCWKKPKRVLTLKVSGAFHSPFMDSARVELSKVIEGTQFSNLYVRYTKTLPASQVVMWRK